MKNVKLYALMAMLLFTIPHSHGAVGGANTDTTIRVLLVADNLLVDPAVIADQVAFFEQTWTNTGLNAQATIQIVNIGDVPLEFYLGFSTPSLGYANWPTLHGRVKEFVNGPLDPTDPSSLSIRDAYAADVIVAFATNIPFFCGYGDQRDWAGVAPSFQENPLENNLDLRGKDKYHIALVSLEFGTIDCDDRDYLVAHEFGHLLGGGHYNDPTSGRSWLYSNSRADTDTHILNWPGLGPITWYNISALGSNNNSKCGGGCIWARSYSKSLWSWDDPIRSNRLALAITATSVANYVNGNGIVGQGSSGGTTFQCSDGTDNDGDSLVDTLDSDCTGPTDDSEAGPPPPPGPPGCLPYSYVPTNLTKTLLQLCVPGTSKTEYRIRWDHACPSDALYKVYGTTAGEGTYFLTATESQSVIVRIEAPPVSGSVSVSACFGITCSALSPGIVIFDQC